MLMGRFLKRHEQSQRLQSYAAGTGAVSLLPDSHETLKALQQLGFESFYTN